MIIFVKFLTSITIELYVEPYETILDLKKKIKRKKNMFNKQQLLQCHGVQLYDDFTLEYYNIKHHDIVHLCFPTMENLRQVELANDSPTHLTITKKGLFLVGICVNDNCSINNNEYVSSLGMGTFNLEYLFYNCICPNCNMRSDYTTIGLFDCKIYVSGITNVGFKKEFSKIINECKIVNIKPETMQKNLLIKVAEKKLESVKFAIKLNDNNE